MPTKLDDVVAQALALPREDRAKVVARIQASLAENEGSVAAVAASLQPDEERPPRLLDLAGTGRGMWGEDSDEYLRQLRDEWH